MPEGFYTVEEIAAYLKVSDQTIRDWLRRGKVRGIKVGRAWRIPNDEVQRVAAEGIEEDGEGQEEPPSGPQKHEIPPRCHDTSLPITDADPERGVHTPPPEHPRGR